jgi:serine protease inhibitor
VGDMPVNDDPQLTDRNDLRQVLDEELQRLPAKYRTPLVLCYLEGKTHQEAAAVLGWPRGSMAKRLERGQELLRERLVGRGVALSAGLAAVLAAERTAAAAVPASLASATVRAASLIAAGEAAIAGGFSLQVTTLAEGVMKAMLFSKVRNVLAVVLVLGLLAGGVGWFWQSSQAADTNKTAKLPSADPVQVKADKIEVVKGNTEFAFDLYGRLRGRQGNLFLSPYSISTALAMSTSGAREQTLDQMAKTLHFPVDQVRLHPAFGALVQETKNGKGYQLNVANALWCQIDHPFRDDFLSLNETYYNARPIGVDFAKRTEEARQTINQWVEKQTQDKIKELIPPGNLTSKSRLVLTNAIYFKGDWDHQFNKKATKDEPFFGTAEKRTVPLMRRHGSYKYLDGGTFQALELPYLGKELAMVAFLPKQTDGLPEFEKSLTTANLAAWLPQLRDKEVNVFLPRFKMTIAYNLNGTLQSMGMSDAFDPDRANFGGVTPDPRGMYITAVLHKAFVEVNEEGTEAAAATAIVKAPGAAIKREPDPVFRADHPFFFLIRDNRTGSILFMGRLTEPQS